MENLSLVALLTPVFSALMILRAFSLWRRHQQSWRELLLWILLWLGIAFIAFWPGVLDLLPAYVGIKSGVNVLIFFGFVVLFYGFFRMFTKMEELERKLVQMNRQLALKEKKSAKVYTPEDSSSP